MLTDLRFAWRQLLKSPGFTLLAVVTLAIGIGLDTAIFSLIDDLFLRGLPYPEQDRVVHPYANAKDRGLDDMPLSAPRFMHFREAQAVFSDVAAESGFPFTLTGLGDAVQISGGRLTWNYFRLLGVVPILGRNFRPEEEDRADVALVTERFWRMRLGGDPNVIGRAVVLDGTVHTIVGVLPDQPAAWFGANAEVWTTKPLVIPGYSYERMMRGTGFLRVLGRLKPGVTLEQARAALSSLDRSYAATCPRNVDRAATTSIKTLPEDVTGNLRPAFAMLLAAVSLVLLVACSNVANLLLARFSGRRPEIAVRLSLGASRATVLRLFLFESLLVSALAGVAGAIVASRLLPLVPVMASNFLPLDPGYDPGLSLPLLAFMTAVSMVTGFATGLYPALLGSRADAIDGLKEGARGTSGSRRHQRFRSLLVASQIAVSVALLAGAALLVTSFVRLTRQELGFDPRHLWVGFVMLPEGRYADLDARQRFADRTLGALKTVHGVESASISDELPLLSGGRTLYARADAALPPVDERASAPGHHVTPGYLKTVGIPLVAGRDFDEHDVANGRDVLLISQAGARKVFPDENPIGKALRLGSAGTLTEIVGVVGDVRSERVADPPGMEFYRPWAQDNFSFTMIAVRSELQPNAVTRLVQFALTAVDPGLAVTQPQTMETVVAHTLGHARLVMWLLGVFAAAALALATIGVYGALACTVDQRTGEIGVRMALGAGTRDILRLVVRQGMRPVVAGLAVGLVATLALGRVIASQLYQTSANDPLALAATISALGLAALAACVVPAHRASRVNPIDALRVQ